MAIADQRIPLYTGIFFETLGPAQAVFNQEIFGKSYTDIGIASSTNSSLSSSIKVPVKILVAKNAAFYTNYSLSVKNKLNISRATYLSTAFSIMVFRIPVFFNSTINKGGAITGIKGRVTLLYNTLVTVQKTLLPRISMITSFMQGLSVNTNTNLRLQTRLGVSRTTSVTSSIPLKNGVVFSYNNTDTIGKSLSLLNPKRFTLSPSVILTKNVTVRTASAFNMDNKHYLSNGITVTLITPPRMALSSNVTVGTTVTPLVKVEVPVSTTVSLSTLNALRSSININYLGLIDAKRNIALSSASILPFGNSALLNFSVLPRVDIKMNFSRTISYGLGINDLINVHIPIDITFNLDSTFAISCRMDAIAVPTTIAVPTLLDLSQTIKVTVPVDFALSCRYDVVSMYNTKTDIHFTAPTGYQVQFSTGVATELTINFQSALGLLNVPSVKLANSLTLLKTFNVSNTIPLVTATKLDLHGFLMPASTLTIVADNAISRASFVNMYFNTVPVASSTFKLIRQKYFNGEFSLKGDMRISKSSFSTFKWDINLEIPSILAVSEEVNNNSSSITLGGAVLISFDSSFAVNMKPWRSSQKIVDINVFKHDVDVIWDLMEWESISNVKIERL